MTSAFTDIYHRLLEIYGPQGWWPADSPFEVVLGAVLTQNTAWRNVESALVSLKEAVALDPEPILNLEKETLQNSIRPSGYYRQKAQRLRILCRYLTDNYDGDLANMETKGTTELRGEFLDLHGIGPETADSILLYAFNRPVFVVDAYTIRLFERLGHLSAGSSYNQVQEMFMDSVEPDPAVYNEYHALIVIHGKELCRKTQPLCSQCRLADMCCYEAAA